jgi:hypothetical protein
MPPCPWNARHFPSVEMPVERSLPESPQRHKLPGMRPLSPVEEDRRVEYNPPVKRVRMNSNDMALCEYLNGYYGFWRSVRR